MSISIPSCLLTIGNQDPVANTYSSPLKTPLSVTIPTIVLFSFSKPMILVFNENSTPLPVSIKNEEND
jgi:hypothetical protein